ncbi:hypothetical protein SPRG_05336 [Saprolegnia parasitica CBS 223.65]|uniref:Nucleoporin Nup159/Nup146 N-terminal domain-containing protein n=1 Tax=Saprolegnia parasitica (strain CBS 223.65) TaxID=695850 RepID=A0A067CHD1_SAPPC|nr:hypothetical protein SPRG_05336 [Saprolegnia parasitica CBS 223.65]KDO30144.1 hypothetical protein SPRG_05336 [Saprolegnia parasitica CBS 223.65]|eukprot:XP_012199322.1 hypothetical protein SPRG_05336 [Saprolegnia parasitica CBS 223.65]
METEVENVRVLSRGRLEVFPRDGVDEAADALRKDVLGKDYPRCLCHSSRYGLTFLATPAGLGVTAFTTLEEATLASVERAENNVDPLVALPVTFTVALPTSPHFLALSAAETLLAVAFDDVLAVYEVARLVEGSHNPIFMSNNVQTRHLCWSSMQGMGQDAWLVVLTTDRQIHVYNMKGDLVCAHSNIEATSICWAPEGSVLAVGDDEGIISKLEYTYDDASGEGHLTTITTYDKPDHVGDSCRVHHLNWAETDLLFAGYINDEDEVASCIFDGDGVFDTTELVAFFMSDSRAHVFYSCYLQPWRMFFVGCSLSTDIELLVSDPESGEWQIWKPQEKYSPRLPMDADDEDTYPVGMAVALNSTAVLPGDEVDSPFYACPLVLCATTDGILLNFALLDTNEADFPYLVVPASPVFAAVGRSDVKREEETAVPPRSTRPRGNITMDKGSFTPDISQALARMATAPGFGSSRKAVTKPADLPKETNQSSSTYASASPPSRAPPAPTPATPSHAAEDALWKQILAFDRTLQQLRATPRLDVAAHEILFYDVRRDVLATSDGVQQLDRSFHATEADVAGVVSQSKTVRDEIDQANRLQEFADPATEPLDARSLATYEELQRKMRVVQETCACLTAHLGYVGLVVVTDGSLIECGSCHRPNEVLRALKHSYDRSKEQYNHALDLARHMDKLTPAVAQPVAPSMLLALREEDASVSDLDSVFGTLRVCAPRLVSTSLAPPPTTTSAAKPPRVRSSLLSTTALTIPAPPKTPRGHLSFQAPSPMPTKPVQARDAPTSETTACLNDAPSSPGGQSPTSSVPSTPTRTTNPSKPIKVAMSPKAKAQSPRQRPTPIPIPPRVVSEPESDESPRARKMSLGARTPPPSVLGRPPTPKLAARKTAYATDVKSRPIMSPLSLDAPNYLGRLESFCAKYAPGHVIAQSAMERLLRDHAGRETELFLQLLRQFVRKDATESDAHAYVTRGALPPPPTVNYKALLTAFYAKHNPAKLPEVDELLAKYHGNEARLFKSLQLKYTATNAASRPTYVPA